MRKYKEVAMKNKLRRKLTALALCGVMIFSGSSSALADSQAGEIDENQIVQEQVLDEVIEEADTEVQEPAVEEATQELVPETVEPVIEEAPVEEVVEEVVEEQPQVEIQEVEAQPTVVEQVVEAVATATEKVVEVVETVIRYIIGMHDDLTYEDDQVIIKVYAEQDEIIPEGTKIKVVPILADDEATKAQYEEVAAGLQEKAAADEQIIEGFLAYDITLVDPEGNEFEPNGEVKVTMDYKKAALPADVENVEEAEVTIHHFEEDANGEVKQIVDMVAEAAIEAVVEVTEAAEVEKAEFKTESFSVFTITWTGTSSRKATITVHYVDDEGNELNGSQKNNVTLSSNSLDLEDYATAIDGYVFKRIDLDSLGSGKSAIYLRVNNNTLQYSNSSGYWATWTDWEEISTNENAVKDIYIVYGTLTPITTVDSKSEHVNISLTDYSIWTETQKSWSHNVMYDINDGHSLKFVTSGNQLSSPNYNVYTGGSSPRQGFVNNNLSSDYPKLKAAGESLDYLFNTTGKTYDANYLFQKVDGYYVYDSKSNFAEFDTTTEEFTVYGQPNAGFFPFNNFTDDLEIVSAATNAGENHHFGMHVDFTFMQPKSGTVGTAPMEFEFKGDDDVWVFIDGMLVLDLGGIHQSSGGTINFATGKIDYTDATDTTIYAMYVDAWEEAGKTPQQITDLTNQYFVQDTSGNYRFKDYSQHKLDFFYLERGAHDTNCKIKFNLIAIPENTVSIEKEITKANMANFADAEFKFQIEKKDVNNDGTYPSTSTLLANTSYKLYSVDANGNRTFIADKVTDANGQFTLKHRQVAEFSGIKASTKYCVTEIGVTSEVYDKVDVNGYDIQIKNSTDENGLTKKDYTTGDLLAQEYVYAKFGNQCNASNLRNLIIEKVMPEGQSSEETFELVLEFKEGNTWIPYNGTYYVDDLSNDSITAVDGKILLKAGEQAYIIGLISGTEYRVSEELSASQSVNFADPTYSGDGTVTENGISAVIEIGDVTDSGAKREYVATVTNTLLTKQVNVTKVWSDSDSVHESIFVGLYKKVNDQWQATGSYAELKADTWQATFEDLDLSYEYDVKELVPAANGEFTIGTKKYTATNDYYTVGSNDYAVSYNKVDEQYTSTVTITNTLLSKIEVEKVWNDGNIEHTNDTVYVGLYKVNGNQKERIAVKEIKAVTTWKTVFDKLATSAEYTYEVKELIPGDNNSYTAVDEDGIYSNGTFEYKVSYKKVGDSKVVITNTIKDKVVVEKLWADADNANGKRPETLDVYLKDGDHRVTLTLGKDKQGKVENHVLNGKAVRAEFTTDWSVTLYGVSSSYIFEEAPVAGYVSNKVVSDDKVTFTNTFNILIFKQSATDKHALEGAIFKITQGETSYYAESMADGRLGAWYNNEALTGTPVLPDGAFKLSEIKAPAGYMLSEAEWNIQMVNGLIIKVNGADASLVEKINGNLEIEAYTMSFVNEALYELPSTGGLGIYVPMMSGVIMMMAAAFILMNNKRKEVL